MSLQDLLDSEDRLDTAMGKAFLSERVVMRGKDLHHELGSKDWFRVYIFSILGRELSDSEIELMNFMWVSTSFPDPGIWPNHVTALGASVRTMPSLALLAGLSISEADLYGGGPLRKSTGFIIKCANHCEEGGSVEDFVDAEIVQQRTIYGYGRPIARIDERVVHVLCKAETLGLLHRPHLSLALEIHRYLKELKGLSINIAAIIAAVAADMGFDAESLQLLTTLLFVAGMTPCYLDAKKRNEGTFFPMRCDNLDYGGKIHREW